MTPSSRLAALLAGAATLAVPGLAEAHGTTRHQARHPQRAAGHVLTGTVLQADRAHHRLRVLSAARKGTAYRVSGKLSRRVALGARVTFRARGHQATNVKVVGRAHKLALSAHVVRGGAHRSLSLPGGLPLAALGRAHGLRGLLALLDGLKPGQAVTITLTVGTDGTVTIAITLPDGSTVAPGDGPGAQPDPGDTGDGDPGDDGGADPGDDGGDNPGDDGGDDPGDGGGDDPGDTYTDPFGD